MFNSQAIDDSKSKKRNNSHSISFLPNLSLGILVLVISSSTLAYAETIAIDIDGSSFDVEYSATGMTISTVEADLDFISLVLDVNVTGSTGTLEIIFDRTFFDSKFEGVDDAFIVLADGDEPNFTETETTSQIRTLSIEVPSGTEEIEIIGSIFGDASSIVAETPEPVEEAPEPVAETPEPVEEAPEPVAETPEPVEEAPEPVAETPEPVEEAPKTQCGPGTTLQDGVCVLQPTSVTPTTTTDTSIKGMGKEFVIGVVAAFVVAGIIGIISGLMSKASKSKD